MAAVLDARERGQTLPRIDGPALNVRLRCTTDRIEAWRELANAVGATGALHVEQAVSQVSMLADPSEIDAVAEVLVEAVCERAARTREQWFTAMAGIAFGMGLDGQGFALRLARGALRDGQGRRRVLARWTVEWIAEAIDRKAVSEAIARDPLVVSLVASLGPIEIESIVTHAAQLPRRSASRKWLNGIEKTAVKRHRRVRRLLPRK